jgi:hypothetical protein
MTIHLRDTPLDPKAQFLLWSKPEAGSYLDSHELITHPNVSIIARTRAELVNSDKPPGAPNYTIHSTLYSEANAINVGKRFADWFEYQGLYKGMGQAFDGLYGGAVYMQNWGSGRWSPLSLMMDPNDKVSGYAVGYHANAIADSVDTPTNTPLSLKTFITKVFQTMKTECDNRNLCYPMSLAWDLEEFVWPTTIIGLQNGGAAGSAPWLAAIASAKYNTETVYEEWDGTAWVGKTLQDAYLAAGSPVHDPSVWWFQGINRNFVCKMYPYFVRINDHALHNALYLPAKQSFPNILCGNYGIKSCLSQTQSNQFWEIQNNWLRFPKQLFSPGKYFRGDYSSPTCYSPNMITGFSTRYNPSYNVSYPAPEFSGHIFGNTKRDVYRNYIIQIIRASITDNSIPCIPWIESPFEGAASSDFPETHVPDETDILYILQQSYSLGCRTWNVFNPSHSGSGASIQTRIDTFMSTINSFNEWVQSTNKTMRVRSVS